MIEWFEKEACDGFMLMAPTYPESFEKFVYLVIPIFQERVILEATMRVICSKSFGYKKLKINRIINRYAEA